MTHSNEQRPHQGLSCHHQPPRTAFAQLPTLPAVPEMIDPDSWLLPFDGLHLERKVNRNGTISLDLKSYYISSHLVGHRVVLQLDAPQHCLHVFFEHQPLKEVPLRGLVGHPLSFEQFLEHMLHQARLRSLQERRYRTAP